MRKPSALFTAEDRKAVKAAVAEAEAKTSAEIVPVVAAASGRYDRAEDIFGVLCAMALVWALWAGLQDVSTVERAWGLGLEPRLGLPALLAAIAAGFALGSAAAAHFPALKRPFMRAGEIEAEVARAAAAAYRRLRVGRTELDNGVLIYVSLFERRVRVEGGGAAAAKIPEGEWRRVCELVLAGLRDGRPAEGLRGAILAAGRLLEDRFPVRPGDKNELTNDLALLDETP